MKKRKLKKDVSHIIVLFTLVMYLSTFNVTTSRYLGKAETTEDVIAIPILNFNNQELTCPIANNMLPGDVRECYFSISNKEEDKVNEILLEYYFNISSSSAIPLNYELYDITSNGSKQIEIINGASANEKTTEKETMNYKNESEPEVIKQYKLKIIWDAKDNDYTYANSSIEVKVRLIGLQVINGET